MLGDPHVITLDGLQYTFNGKGEFSLIETESNTFTLQGRMVQAVSVSGEASLATVFSAIVGKQNDSDSVQFTLSPEGGIDIAVSGEPIDFDGMMEHSFVNVVIMDKGNNSISATFSSGAYIEVRASNGILSLLLVSLPITFFNKTRGLMGSYNGNKFDDLTPKLGDTVGEPLSVNSSLDDIHTQFGITCKLMLWSWSGACYKFITLITQGSSTDLKTAYSHMLLEKAGQVSMIQVSALYSPQCLMILN